MFGYTETLPRLFCKKFAKSSFSDVIKVRNAELPRYGVKRIKSILANKGKEEQGFGQASSKM